MFDLLSRFIPAEWRFMALSIIGALLVAALGVQTLRVANLKTDLAETRESIALETAQRERIARLATQAITTRQARHAAEQQESLHAYNTERTARLAAERDADLTRQRLRDTLRTLSPGRGLWPSADPVACRGDGNLTATLGNLLEQADDLAHGLAAAAEQHASEVRLLLAQIHADREACRPFSWRHENGPRTPFGWHHQNGEVSP